MVGREDSDGERGTPPGDGNNGEISGERVGEEDRGAERVGERVGEEDRGERVGEEDRGAERVGERVGEEDRGAPGRNAGAADMLENCVSGWDCKASEE
ncbi:hypothetical protein ACFX2I_031206 [Malus domestica]